jgi:hypothetical protein
MLKLASEKNRIILLFSHQYASLPGIDIAAVRKHGQAALKQRNQPGSATVVAILQVRCGRNFKISAEQTRSAADNLLQKTAKTAAARRKRCVAPL